jgi:choline dehydrogenase-like flavoprotein
MGTDGEYMGFGICPNTAFKGYRSTAADLLTDGPNNLEIVTHAHVKRVVFEDRKAVGVETLEGTIYQASKEVILSSGSLDSPRILMHSGIGPRDQLTDFSIPVIHENKNVGQGLRDHCHNFLSWERTPGSHGRAAYFNKPKSREAAQEQ